jgi:hypothetical protein
LSSAPRYPKKPTRNARASVFRSHGIGVDATDSLQAARTLSRTKPYDLILLEADWLRVEEEITSKKVRTAAF